MRMGRECQQNDSLANGYMTWVSISIMMRLFGEKSVGIVFSLMT